jgi:hypothetical protein
MDENEFKQEWAERFLGAKVCLQEVLDLPIPEGDRQLFDDALEAAMRLENSL